jgi:hypothetical protein
LEICAGEEIARAIAAARYPRGSRDHGREAWGISYTLFNAIYLNTRFQSVRDEGLTLNKKELSMKIKSVSASAFFNPRALLGFGFGSLGLLLGLVAFIALPKQSALAGPAPCTDVEYGKGSADMAGTIYVTMESHSVGYPNSPCTIYFTVGAGNPPNPTHSSAIYTHPYPVFYGETRFFKAFGHKTYAVPEDSGITSFIADNSGN